MSERQTPRIGVGTWRLVAMSMVLVFCSLWLLGQTAGKARQSSRAIDVSDEFYKLTPVLAEAYMAIREKYVENVEPKALIEGAIQGMFTKLDPHSQWMPADDYQQLEKETEGEFSGIGIHIILDKNRILTVIAPIPGTPAAKAGMLPWDRIIEIDGQSTENITLIEAVKKLTGPNGTKVKLGIYREGVPEKLNFEIERAQIKIESVYNTEFKDDDIGYVRLAKFSKETSDDLRKALDKFNRDGVKGIILDLRFNTGGLLKEAIDVSDLFLAKGLPIVIIRQRGGEEMKYFSENEPIANQPMVVLVNRGSASASEILAGALKDHRRGYILASKGERTFGKGSVQTIEELTHSLDRDANGNPRRSAVRITTAKFFTPNGTRIEAVKDDPKQPGGVAPDLEVEVPKNFERELFGNLLGEVDVDEAHKKPEGKPEAKPETKPDDTKSTGTKKAFYIKSDDEKTTSGKFVDLQLAEGRKYVRLLILENTRKEKATAAGVAGKRP
jgi:carboxyl-terminal processing protease